MAIIEHNPARLSLGPIQFFWPKQKVLDFYESVKNSAVNIIYLGETVCSKRRQLRPEEWLEVAAMLSAAGKDVVISSMALLMSESELNALKSLCNRSEFVIEANDLAAVNILANSGKSFVCGPTTNIYNARTLGLMQRQGAIRWVMPVELSGATLRDIICSNQKESGAAIETEVFCYGHLPLAYSARCFTARHLGLSKDDCQFRCMDYPEGLPLFSQEQQQLFNINGIQTQSAAVYNLLSQIPDMLKMGVDVFRISPRESGIGEVIERFHQAIRGEGNELSLADDSCNGYWFGEPGMAVVQSLGES